MVEPKLIVNILVDVELLHANVKRPFGIGQANLTQLGLVHVRGDSFDDLKGAVVVEEEILAVVLWSEVESERRFGELMRVMRMRRVV